VTFTVPAPDRRRALLRLESRMLALWVDETLDRFRKGEITEAQARERIQGHLWSYRIGRAVARVMGQQS
jgi:hypothetical protein